MTDFVYDGTALPDGKSDYRPLTTPAAKSYTAAEWNTVMAAIADLRSAALAGDYHGLVDAAAAVSAAGAVRFRSSGGRAQVSEGGSAYRLVRDPAVIHAADYGAVGDGVTNDAAALAAALTAARASGATLQLEAKTYLVSTGIAFTGTTIHLRGKRSGDLVSTIKAGATMAALTTFSGTHVVEDILFDANYLATKAVSCNNGAAFTSFTRCEATKAKQHGFWIGDTGVNDGLVFTECWARLNGRYQKTSGAPSSSGYLTASQVVTITGSVATTSGSPLVTGTSTTFTALGLEAGDLIVVGAASSEVGQVVTVDSDTQITCAKNFDTSRSAQEFGSLSGCGLAEARHNDANINKVYGGLYRSNAAAGLMIRGLYGSRVYSAQTDTNAGFGVILGDPTTGNPTYNPTIQNCYFESNGIAAGFAAAIRLGAAEGAFISNNMFEGSTPISYGAQTVAISGLLFGKTELSTLGNENSFKISAPVSHAHRNGIGMFGPPVANWQNIYSIAGAALPLGGLDYGAADLQWYFDTAADKTVTAAPSATGGIDDGVFRITNFDATYCVTLQDESVLSGSKLYLTAPKRVLLPGESILFYKRSGFYWEIGGTRDVRPADSTATPGNATQDKRAGLVKIAAGAASVTVTNKLVTATSVIHATLQFNDATLTQILRVVPGAGSFVITGNANATANTQVCWTLVS